VSRDEKAADILLLASSELVATQIPPQINDFTRHALAAHAMASGVNKPLTER
jgi:hypothetical protein